MKSSIPWKKDGLKFQCQMSGNCCTSRGEYGFVYVSDTDRKKLSRQFKISLKEFTENYCEKTDGLYHIIEIPNQPDCVFLEDKKCLVYENRPTQCRTWPFWPENMNAKTWNTELTKECPGIGKGQSWAPEEIENALRDQEVANKDV